MPKFCLLGGINLKLSSKLSVLTGLNVEVSSINLDHRMVKNHIHVKVIDDGAIVVFSIVRQGVFEDVVDNVLYHLWVVIFGIPT